MRRSPLLVALVVLLSAAREAHPQACPITLVAQPINNCGAGGGGGATAALDNLASVAINTALLPGATGKDLGAATTPFRFLYLHGAGTYGTGSFKLTGTPTAARTITFPDASITVARTDAAQTFTGIQTFASPPTSPSGFATAEQWGAGASAGDHGVAFGGSSTAGAESTAGGYLSYAYYGTAYGRSASASVGSTALGSYATVAHTFSISLGDHSATTADYQLVAGSVTGGAKISDVYVGNGVTAASPAAVTYHATGGSGTNVSGATHNTAAGISTGNAFPGLIQRQGGALGGSSGTTAQTLVNRVVENATMTGLSTGTATSLFDVSLASSPSSGGGQVLYNIRASDGTDEQSCAGIVYWTARRTGAGPTYAGTTTVNEACTGSSGTLSTAWAFTSGTNKTTMKVTPTVGTITATTVEITYEVHNQGRGELAVVPF